MVNEPARLKNQQEEEEPEVVREGELYLGCSLIGATLQAASNRDPEGVIVPRIIPDDYNESVREFQMRGKVQGA